MEAHTSASLHPRRGPTSRYFQHFPNIFQALCLFLVYFYIKNNRYIKNLMYSNNCYGLERHTFLLFNRNIIPLSVFLDKVMKLLSCDWIHDHRPNTGKRRNSYIGCVCYVLVRICSDFAFCQVVLTLHVNAYNVI